MAVHEGGNLQNEVTREEHQHNLLAKRVAVVDGMGLLSGVHYDYVTVTYPNSTTDVFTFKNGGSSGTTVATVTLVYTDTTKNSLSSVALS